MKGTCGLRCLRATLLSDKFLRLFVVSGRIRLIGYVCVLRGSNIYGNRIESANRLQHASSMHSIRLCATQHYACCLLVDSHYASICSAEPGLLKRVLQC